MCLNVSTTVKQVDIWGILQMCKTSKNSFHISPDLGGWGNASLACTQRHRQYSVFCFRIIDMKQLQRYFEITRDDKDELAFQKRRKGGE